MEKNSLKIDSTKDIPEEGMKKNEEKVSFEKPKVVRIRRIVAAGGHKG